MISNKLKEKGFYLDSYTIGVHDTTCPFCSASRKASNRKKKICRVWIDEDSASWHCIHCGEKGFIRNEVPAKRVRKYVRPSISIKDNLGIEADKFFTGRGLTTQKAKELGIFIENKNGEPMIAYPYFKNGVVVNVKYRGIKEKKFIQEKDGEPVFYNYDNCFGLKEIIIVEGENDVLAFREVGITNVVSIPSGSISQEIDKDEDSSKFDFLKNSLPLIESCNKFILALDSDSAGQAMTKALVDRLGRAKCWLVDWSLYDVDGKDANDFLKADKRILKDAINLAKPLPLRGISNAADDFEEFEDYLTNGVQNAISTGFTNLDNFIKFDYGNFITITGYPGSGKSNFATQLVMNMAKNSGIKTLFCSFETTPNQLKKKWCQTLIGRPTINANEQTIEDVRNVKEDLKNFYIMQDYTTTLTLDNILEMAEQAIIQYGIKCLFIDPLNKISYTKTNNQTEDIGSVLNKLTAFAKKHKILVFLVAHPTKPENRGKLGTQDVPNGFDIAGSANFLNMSDVVITVHRKQNEYGEKSKSVRILISKVRDTDFGHEGSCYFHYDSYAGKYNPCDREHYESEKMESGLNSSRF